MKLCRGIEYCPVDIVELSRLDVDFGLCIGVVVVLLLCLIELLGALLVVVESVEFFWRLLS